MKEGLKSAGSFILFIGIAALYISGGIHSSKKHDEGSLSWWLPPWGWYRGVEQFWHNDYSDVDWNKRIHSDTKIIFYLIYSGILNDRDELKFQNDLNKFKKQINNYPDEKVQILKNNASTYISFINSMDEDFLRLFSNDTIFYKTNFFSIKTNLLLDSVILLSDPSEVNDFKIGYEQAFGSIDTTIYLPSGAYNLIVSNGSLTKNQLQNVYTNIFER